MSHVIIAEQLNRDQIDQITVGICPNCGGKLWLSGHIEVEPAELMMVYNKDKWDACEDIEVDYIYDNLQCQQCTADYDVGIVQNDELRTTLPPL